MGGKGQRERHRGQACIEYANAQEAQAALATLNGSELDGRALTLDVWTGSNSTAAKGDNTSKIYVQNVSFNTRGWKLKQHFSQAGNVVYYKQMVDKQAHQAGVIGGKGKGKVQSKFNKKW